MSNLKDVLKGLSSQKPHNDHRHQIIRRYRTAIRCRDTLYGKKVPVHDGRRLTWANTIREFTTRRWFHYRELWEEAEKLRTALSDRFHPDDTFNAPVDLDLLRAFEAWLRSRVEEEPWRKETHKEGDSLHWAQKAQIRQDLLDGLCPWCGEDLPCETHGLLRAEIDGKGGLLVHTPEGPKELT